MNLRASTIIFLFSTFIIIQAKEYVESLEYREFQEFKEFEEFKKWKKEKELSGQLNRDDESKSYDEKNEQSLLRKEAKEFEKNNNNSEEKSNNEKQKWKDKKWNEKNKNKDYYKKKNYKKSSDDDDEGNKSYELQNNGRHEERKKKKYEKFKNSDEMKQNFERIEQFQENDDPPPINEAALMARYIVNQANWTSVATISSRKDIRSFPSANVISFSDGIIGNGSGIPYMYLTPLDFTAQDIIKDNRASLMMTLAQGRYCKTKNYDPMDPRCARVILTGKIRPVNVNSTEIVIAEKAVFNRHPWLQKMPADHHFFFAKLKIASIAMLDTFGGPKFVPVRDYLHPPTPNINEEFSRLKSQESNEISEEFGGNNPYVTLV